MSAKPPISSDKISADGPHNWPRLDGVDLLRGLAIFLVLMNHVHMRLFLSKIPYLQGIPAQLVSSLVWSGQYGVQIFFSVSGFLITSTSIRRWGSLAQVRLRDFYALRVARIAPLFLLLLVVLCALHQLAVNGFVVSDKSGGLARALLAALTFHVNLLEAKRGYLPASWDVLWSLSVEEMFYLFFPVVCSLLGRSRWLETFFLIFVALGPIGRTVLAHGNEIWQEYSYLGGMDAIALGCLTALWVSSKTPPRHLIRSLGALGAALILLVLGCSSQVEAWGLTRTGLDMTILALGSCLLIAASAQTRWPSPRIALPLVRFGQHSYEVYLTHMFVVFALFALFKAAGQPIEAIPAFFIGAILIAGFLGELIARFYSEPMNRLIRRRLGDGLDKMGSAITSTGAA